MELCLVDAGSLVGTTDTPDSFFCTKVKHLTVDWTTYLQGLLRGADATDFIQLTGMDDKGPFVCTHQRSHACGWLRAMQ